MRRQIALLTLLVFAVGVVLRLESAAAAPPSSLQFDGANDIVRTANLPLLTQFTVEAWVKRTADAGTWQTFLSDANSSYSQTMFTLYVDGGSRDCSGVSDQFAFYQASGSSLQCSGVTAAPGVWYHVAVSRDANGARRLFVNGVLRSTQTNSPAPTDSSGVLTFGRAGDFAGEYFAGLIDEARLSNVAVYTADFAPPVAPLNAEAGTIALWHFDEGAGQTTTDASGNARTGILGTSASADSADPAWSTDSPIGAAPSTPTASATDVATPAASVTPTDGATSPAATPTATASSTPAVTDLASVTPTPSLTPLPSEVGYALRFFGNGQNDIDRVKIQIDDPANTNPGPPADVGAQDFTLEFWMKANAADNPAAAVACGANNNWIFGHVVIDRDRFNQDRKFGLSLAGGRVVFGVAGEGAGSLTLCGVTPVLDGQWHHVAVQRRRSDGWLWLYVDGLLQAQADGPDGDIAYPDDGVPGNFCGGPCTNSDPYLVFGAEKHDAGPEYRSYNGHLDEVRLSNSLRYSADFTRPAQPFVPDAATVALYHFDEGAGDMIGDTSGAAGGPSHGVRRFGGSPAGPLWVVDSPFPPPMATPTPTDSSPLTPTATDAPAASETPAGTSTATSAPSPTATAPPSSTATATAPPPASSPTNTPGAPPTPTNTPTASHTATSTPTATTAPSDLIFADGFESGNLSAWSASVVDGGDLSVAAAAALVGGQGLQAVLDDNVSLYLTDDRPAAETRYRARFYFDPNTIAMTNGDAHFLFYGYAGTSTLVTRLEFRRSSGVYQIRAALRNDASTYTSTSWFTLSDAPHAVEIDWRAASGAGANNGGLTLWLDGVQRADLTGVDNDTRRIDRVQLGAVAGVDSGTRGTYYFDAFESRRQTYIGLDPGQPPASTPTPTLPPTFTPTPAPSATPGGNAALSFDGVNDELRAAAVTGTGPLTVEAWVRPAAAGANDILIINGDANTGWSLEINSGRLTFWLSTNLGWRSVQHATALQSGQWYHVAGTYSGGSAQVFVNGSASGSASVGTLSQGPSLRLGGMAGFPYFAGVLDEVRLSNVVRYSGAFTPAARFTPDAGTLALWHLDEGAGQSAADASASANHATLGASTGADSADPAWTAGGP